MERLSEEFSVLVSELLETHEVAVVCRLTLPEGSSVRSDAEKRFLEALLACRQWLLVSDVQQAQSFEPAFLAMEKESKNSYLNLTPDN